MTRAIEPLVNQRDYFNSVRIDRARLYSQIVDNMNKAALVGFPISEIGARLKSALGGGVEQAHIFDDAQTCALEFRQYCLSHNLLDFSLYLEIFRDQIMRLPQARAYLRGASGMSSSIMSKRIIRLPISSWRTCCRTVSRR